MKMKLFFFISFSIFILGAPKLRAQPFAPKFDHLTSADGLASNTVNCILRDRYGFMWFGTYNGLCRYDGYDFTTYVNSSKNKMSLTDSRISALIEDKDGVIYVGTWGKGLNVYDRKLNGFVRYNNNPADSTTISSDEISCLFIDSKDRIWIGTKNGGLNLFDPIKKSFKSFKFDPIKNSEQLDVFGISELPDGNLILATRGEGISFFDVQTGKYTLFHNPNIGEADFVGWEKSLYKDSQGIFWIACKDEGVFRFNYTTREVKEFKNSISAKNSLSSNIPTQVLEYGDGKLLIGTDGGGLNCLDTKTGFFSVFKNELVNLNSLSSNAIYSLFVDDRNILWVGTFGGGINIFDSNKEKFTSYLPNPTDPNSIANRSILAIFQDKDENIWIGTDGGGLDLYNPKLYGEKFIHFKNDPNNPNSLSSNVVKSIFQDSRGTLWLGTWNGGLEKFDPKTRVFEHHLIKSKPYGLRSNNIWSIIEDDEHNLWCSTLGSGLDVINLDTYKIKHYSEGPAGNELPHRNIMTMLLDSKKRVWLGTEGGGLMMYNKKSDTFLRFRNDPSDCSTISSDDIRTIFEDSSGRFWIGTQAHGLNLLDEAKGTFKEFTEEDGLIGNAVYGILEDSLKNLWISTTKGISKLSFDNLKFSNYSQLDGLIDAEFNYSSALKAKDGRFYFGGLNGFNAFFPEKIVSNTLRPNAYITNLKLFNQVVVPGDETHILDKSIIDCSEITVNHKQSVLTFQYTGINYTSSSKNQFAYKLEGFEKKWNYVKAKREATYTNLDPGTYIFRVKVSNNDGIWNEEGCSLKIIVLPPFWATWWFRITLLLALILSVYLYIRYKIRSIELQSNLLKVMVDDRTLEINKANHELAQVNVLLEETNEEIFQQKEQLVFQTEQLEKHRNHLEELVAERTEQLVSAKEIAEESERLKSSFLANMSHEIRTPLNAIVGFSNFLTMEVNSPGEVAEFTSIIKKNTEDLLMLIDDIVDLSELESKQSKRIDANFKVNHFLSHFFQHWESHQQTEKRVLKLVNNVYDSKLILFSDEHKIRQILTNLMSNACKFTESGTVTLMFDHKDGNYIFSVTDTGIGIAEHNLEFIFDRFRKIEDNKKQLFRGNGLGLAISARLAEVLSGKLWAVSKLDHGSTFFFSIPENLVRV